MTDKHPPQEPAPLGDLDLSRAEQGEERRGAPPARHGKAMSIWFVIGLLLSVAAVGYIILDGGDEAVFAYTVSQAHGIKDDLTDKKFRVRGTVKEGTIQAIPGTLESRFDLEESGRVITITYDKALPDTFKPGLEVIAEGQLDDSGVVVAENIIAKCPSKYEEGAPTARGMGGAKHPEGIPKHPEGIPKAP